MTNKISVAASGVRAGDPIRNDAGTTAHPTFARGTVTEVHREDGPTLLTTADAMGPHGGFRPEPDERFAVARYPESSASGAAVLNWPGETRFAALWPSSAACSPY